MSDKQPSPGRVAGGHAKAAKLTPQERIAAARRAARARWKSKIARRFYPIPLDLDETLLSRAEDRGLTIEAHVIDVLRKSIINDDHASCAEVECI